MSKGPLVDSFGRIHRYLRLSLTDQCNLRCGYCLPPGVQFAPVNAISLSELERLLHVFVSRCGVSKIRLTGGEPTVRKDFRDVLSVVGGVTKDRNVQLGITSNGVLLPKYLPSLQTAGFTLINLSMDTLDRAKFPLISNRSELFYDRSKEALDACSELLERGEIGKLKMNTVIMQNMNEDEIPDFVALTQQPGFEVRFIELMPFAGNGYSEKLFFSKSQILQTVQDRFGKVEIIAHEGGSSVGRNIFRVPAFGGTFGIISSMTDAFCSSCDRLRLTASGGLRNCLFSSSDSEEDLVGIVRRGGSDEEVERAIRSCVGKKFASYGGKETPAEIHRQAGSSRPMIQIGG